MADLRQRDIFKASILKLINYINNVDIANIQLTDLTMRQKCINDNWDRFVNIHLEIIGRTGPAELAT